MSEFKNTVKHAFPQRFVRMVAEVIRPRGVQVKLGPAQYDRELIIGGGKL